MVPVKPYVPTGAFAGTVDDVKRVVVFGSWVPANMKFTNGSTCGPIARYRLTTFTVWPVVLVITMFSVIASPGLNVDFRRWVASPA